jgi:fumarylacetoacetase
MLSPHFLCKYTTYCPLCNLFAIFFTIFFFMWLFGFIGVNLGFIFATSFMMQISLPSNDPRRKSWVSVPAGSDFPIQNLPFGIFKTGVDQLPRIGVAIGEHVVDVAELAAAGLLDELTFDLEVLHYSTLNRLAGLGRSATRSLRERISELLSDDCAELRDAADLETRFLLPLRDVQLCMPVEIRDYTDFYSSIEHATNVGIMFRGKDNALMPNWKHLPVGYHGRASSIVVSGTEIIRPKGQMLPADATEPVFGPTRLLDFELETAFIIGKSNPMGQPIPIGQTEDHFFGMVLFNDWSARDIQSWEYVPLGPFLGKNFASSISPWIVTMDALEPFRVAGPVQEPQPLPYLQSGGAANFDIALEVQIVPASGQALTVSRSNFKYMYWSMQQQLAHHTVNGCPMASGDMCASGTISGPTEDSYGSMLELTWRGSKPITMPDGSERKFLQDGDTVLITGHCEKDGVRIGFGGVSGRVLPSLS